MAFPAFLDACVLVPITLTDLLLRLAEAGTYRLSWSDEVLAEVERTLPRVGVNPDKACWRVRQMREAFPDALVTGHEALIPAMTNHPKDRHVLAAAVRADAAVIVTHNLRDFPDDAIRPYDITVVHPDEFLLDQLDLYPAQTVQCVCDQIAACQSPAVTADELLGTFATFVPRFAETIRELLLDDHQHRPLS